MSSKGQIIEVLQKRSAAMSYEGAEKLADDILGGKVKPTGKETAKEQAVPELPTELISLKGKPLKDALGVKEEEQL